MIHFDSREEVESLTDAQAVAVLDAVREKLIEQLVAQRDHPHLLDDCGDDLVTATDNWARLYADYFNNDGTDFPEFVKKWLLEEPIEWGAPDGEVRFDLCPWGEEVD